MITQQRIEEAGRGTPTPHPKKSKTTAGRFSRPIKGLAKTKPKGGAPLGNQNALKTGRYTAERQARRKEIHALLSDGRTLLRNLNDIMRARP